MKKLIIPLLSLALLLGAGCNKKSGNKISSPNGSESVAYLPPPPPKETDQQKNLRDLREAIEGFRKVKTFRSKLKTSGQSGTTAGQVDVVKPDRFQAKVTLTKGNQTSEIIGIADTLYVRLPDGSWSQIKASALTKAMTEAFRSAVDGETSIGNTALADDTVITKTLDQARDCVMYAVKIAGSDGTSASDMNICVSKGLPKLMEIRSTQGEVTVEYYDYNKVFVIEKPSTR